MGYAVVLGEALVDLLETERDGELIYRQAIGGAPLNVVGRRHPARRRGAVRRHAGQRRPGRPDRRVPAQGRRRHAGAEAGAGAHHAGRDHLRGRRADVHVLRRAAVVRAARARRPGHRRWSRGADVVYTGSICLLREPFRSAARAAWAVPGPLRVFDPNVRPTLLPDQAAVARAARAGRGVLRHRRPGQAQLGGRRGALRRRRPRRPPPTASARLGARAVVVTCGLEGRLRGRRRTASSMLPAPTVAAVDATGAGDSVMGALVRRLLADGLPADLAGWQRNVTLRAGRGRPGLRTPRRRGRDAHQRGADRPLGRRSV